MKIKKYKMFLWLLLCLLLMVPQKAAAKSADLKPTADLTISTIYDNIPIKEMEFQAYLISRMDADGNLTVTEQFSAYAQELDIRGENDPAWMELTEKLAGEIEQKSLTPDLQAVSDQAGQVQWKNLSRGLYLLLGNGKEQEGFVYSVSPFLVMVPERAEHGLWNDQVRAKAKLAQNPLKADFSVIKIWEDDCHKAQRPKSISVDLLCDGKVYDTITLPQDGHWQYTWKDLETNHRWTVEEQPVDGYDPPKISREGNQWTITNTCQKLILTQTGETTQTSQIPQTGQLWWPVPLLLLAGLLLLVAGLVKRRSE